MMRKSGYSKVSYLGVLAGLVGYFFHATMQSGGSSIPLIAFSVLMVLLFWLASVTLEKKPAYQDVFRPLRVDFVLTVLASAALGAGCVLQFRSGGMLARLICVLGLVGALGQIAAGVFRLRAETPRAVLMVPAVLFYVCRLFFDFRGWMIDPAILDYCFSLFALICFMICTYHAASFSFDHGARRRLCFYGLGGVFFGAVALAGAALPQLLIYGGSIGLCLVFSIQALGNGK